MSQSFPRPSAHFLNRSQTSRSITFIASCNVARTINSFHVRFSRSAGQIFAISSLGRLVKQSCFFGWPRGFPLTPFFHLFPLGAIRRLLHIRRDTLLLRSDINEFLIYWLLLF